MSNVSVTVKLSPAKFDLIREELADQANSLRRISNDRAMPASQRSAARKREAAIRLLLADHLS